jgi:hypothetical protein
MEEKMKKPIGTLSGFLEATFGESAKRIVDVDQYGSDCPIYDSYLVTFDGGRLQLSCGGTAIIGFSLGELRRPAYIVHDDSDGQRWDAARRTLAAKVANRVAGESGKASYPDMTEDDWKAYHSSRPHAVLRLVFSA